MKRTYRCYLIKALGFGLRLFSEYNKTMVKENEIYQHYKGNIYTVIAIAKHTETMEEMVVYKDDTHVWVRPLAMFEEMVEVEGKIIPRFRKVSE